MPSTPVDPATCPHDSLAVTANVNRVMLPSGLVGARMLAVQARCEACQTPFWFPGLPTGTDYMRPTSTTDGFSLIAPLVEANRRNQPDPSLPSMSIRNTDAMKGTRPA